LIEEEKFEEASEIGRRQVKNGAQILDVNLENPDRDELADIESLLEMRKDVDWTRIREYFILFNMADAYAELEGRFKHER